MIRKKSNQNPNQNENINASTGATNNIAKGKEKEIINVIEELNIIIKSSEQLSVNFQGESQASQTDLERYFEVKEKQNEKSNNELFHMTPHDRKKLAEEFSGLDRILYEKLEAKTGTRQTKTNELVMGQVIFSVVNTIPIIGNAVQLASTNALFSLLDNERIANEHCFTVAEVKEIINQLGVSNIVDNTEKLKQIKETVMDIEQEFLTRITNLQQQLQEANTRAENTEKQYQQQAQAAAEEKRKNDEKRRKEQQLLQSKEKAEYEAIKLT
ncbi:148_t:CDS:2 [Dentiscutata erythropus]|uniref:148_t:CDS:1 n=1 Tax=Dentiscutata erythropus TaxID=1348616 RepID=A0A9N9AUG3_9GLOM|nr:148_t:CDS:2 [Dentiscutata erythropus]